VEDIKRFVFPPIKCSRKRVVFPHPPQGGPKTETIKGKDEGKKALKGETGLTKKE